MTKAEIRKDALILRNSLKEKLALDKKIYTLLTSSDFYKSAKTVMCYLSFGSEVDTKEIVTALLADKKTVCAPRCLKNSIMEAVKFDSLSELSPGDYGILTPSGEEVINPKDIDLIIVPGAAFNKKFHRIGYGKGYYDRFLAKTNALSCGLFYEFQQIDFTEDMYDIPLNYIITENKIYKNEE